MILFAPILDGAQPAFSADDNAYKLYFKLSDYINFDSVDSIGINIYDVETGKSVVNTQKYIQNTIYKNFNINNYENGYYYVYLDLPETATSKNGDLLTYKEVTTYRTSIATGKEIGTTTIKKYGKFETNHYYRVQIRICTYTGYKGESTTFSYETVEDVFSRGSDSKKTSFITNSKSYLSEWSSGMILKAITPPKVQIIESIESINKYFVTLPNNITISQVEAEERPVFTGEYIIPEDSQEFISDYKYELYENENLLDTSGIITYIPEKEKTNITYVYYRFRYQLQNEHTYTVKLTTTSVNGYTDVCDYTFLAKINSHKEIKQLENLKLISHLNEQATDQEEGMISLYLKNTKEDETKHLSGNFIISRGINGVFEDIKYLNWIDKTIEGGAEIKIFEDYTIESGIGYDYRIQEENTAHQRCQGLILNSVECNFENYYLYSNGVQLKLQYNTSLSNFKHTVQKQKVETIGGRYPTIMRNGDIYYAEMPITSTISLHSDINNKFFTLKPEGYYYKDKLVIPVSKYIKRTNKCDYIDEEEVLINTFNTDLTDNNNFMEKKFLECVEDFLNVDITPKLLKTPNHGNFIVDINEVSFSPKEELGGAISDVSFKAYEIAKNDIDNLVKYGICSIGKYEPNLITEVEYIGSWYYDNNEVITNNLLTGIIGSINTITRYDVTSSIFIRTFQYFTEIKISKRNKDDFSQIKLIIDDEPIYLFDPKISLKYDNLNSKNVINKIEVESLEDLKNIIIDYKAKTTEKTISNNIVKDLATFKNFRQTVWKSDSGTSINMQIMTEIKADLMKHLGGRIEGEIENNTITFAYPNANLRATINLNQVSFQGLEGSKIQIGKDIYLINDTHILTFDNIDLTTTIIGEDNSQFIINYYVDYFIQEIGGIS